MNIQEYGIAAPDPKDPDMVYGSSRTDVTLYNRKTGQSTNVGPDMGPRGGPFNRDVRTMPILWSPVDPSILYYTSNVVWETRDHGRTWTRISPDLARQTWTVPASAGKYGAVVEPAPKGTITALSASPLDDRDPLGGDRRRQHPDDGGRRQDVDERDAARRSSRGPASSTSRPGTSTAARRTPRRTPCASTT